MKRLALAGALALYVAAIPLHGIEVPLIEGASKAASPAAPPPPLRLAESLEIQPMHSLATATAGAADQLEALNAWNRAGRVPAQDGFARPLASPLRVHLAVAEAGEFTLVQQRGGRLATDLQGRPVWGTSVYVPQSYRLRLELRHVSLPPGARLWVWGETGDPVVFDLSLLAADGTLWTPSVAGPTLYLEIQLPSTPGEREVQWEAARILELFALDSQGQALTAWPASTKMSIACNLDAACVTEAAFPGITILEKAIAHLHFVDAGSGYVCTGGLLNNLRNDFTPYLLTANHCIDTQTIATTLEAVWDFVRASCGGSAPDEGALPQTHGATLLAASTSSDYSFLRLPSAPGSRAFLGWTSAASAGAPGTVMHTLSHPFGIPMSLARSTVWAPPLSCTDVPASDFLYSDAQPELGTGQVFPGSSGAPAFLANGQVLGQLKGVCGVNNDEPCLAGPLDSDTNGRFSSTYPALSSWLNPSTSSCVPDATTACLLNNRFRARLRFRSAFDNAPADSDAFRKPVTGFANPNFETVFFYFNSADNVEMLLKMLDQGNTDSQGHPTIAVLFGSATPLRLELTITDTQTGAVKNYTSQFNTQQGGTDFTAFIK